MEASEYEETYEEEEGEWHDAFHAVQMPWWMQKAVPVLISAATHLVFLWIAAFIVFTMVAEKKPQDVVIKSVLIPVEPEWTARPAMFTNPEVDAPVIVDKVIIDLLQDVELTPDIPKGTSFDCMANKNCDGTSASDAQGVGPGRAGAYGQRWGRGSFWNNGGSDATVACVDKALRWLYFHQDADGKWDQDGFDKNCDLREGPACDGKGTSQYDVAVTSLALLAYMGHGHTHRVGQYKKTVKRGFDWLVTQQNSDGSLGPRDAESWIYSHAIGTMALCEAYAITRDYRLKDNAQLAVDYIRAAQNPGLGWKYNSADGRNDTSVTGWIVLALKAAKTAGLNIDQSMFDGAINWFDRVTNTAGKCGYMRPGDDGSVIRGVNEHYAKLPTMTGVSVICRIFCGQPRRDPKILKATDILMDNLPEWNSPRNDKVDMYYWYYATYAMFQYGGENWRKWNKAMQDAIIKHQRQGGCPDGSWDPVGKWGMVGGRVYATAINALTLEIYYRYAKVQQGEELATRAGGR
jgi:hypothetical protein